MAFRWASRSRYLAGHGRADPADDEALDERKELDPCEGRRDCSGCQMIVEAPARDAPTTTFNPDAAGSEDSDARARLDIRRPERSADARCDSATDERRLLGRQVGFDPDRAAAGRTTCSQKQPAFNIGRIASPSRK
jgi:hypothetical protein